MQIANLKELHHFLEQQRFQTFNDKVNIGFALRKSSQRIEEKITFFAISEQGRADVIIFVAPDIEGNAEIRIVAPKEKFTGKQINEFAREIETIMLTIENTKLIQADRLDTNSLLRYILVYNL